MLAREFAGIIDIGQVLVVGDDGNGVGRSLNILTPFSKGKDDCKEFSVIDVIIPFGRKEGVGEIGARVEITIGIVL